MQKYRFWIVFSFLSIYLPKHLHNCRYQYISRCYVSIIMLVLTIIEKQIDINLVNDIWFSLLR